MKLPRLRVYRDVLAFFYQTTSNGFFTGLMELFFCRKNWSPRWFFAPSFSRCTFNHWTPAHSIPNSWFRGVCIDLTIVVFMRQARGSPREQTTPVPGVRLVAIDDAPIGVCSVFIFPLCCRFPLDEIELNSTPTLDKGWRGVGATVRHHGGGDGGGV